MPAKPAKPFITPATKLTAITGATKDGIHPRPCAKAAVLKITKVMYKIIFVISAGKKAAWQRQSANR